MQLVEQLKSKLTLAQTKLEELNEKRRPYALAAVSGDKKAAKAIAELDAEASATGSEALTLEMAIEQAERQAQDEAKAALARERADRVERARMYLADITEVSKECDRLANMLAEALHHRATLITAIAATGTIYPGALKQLQRESTITSAFAAAGLGKFVEWVKGSDRKPLAENVVRPDLIGAGDAE